VGQLIQRFLDILLTLAGVIAILFIVIGGYQYITSRGAEDQAKAGRKTMTYAIIGLIAVLLAYTGVNLVVRLITTGTLFG
jgi:TRAP-type C4-dicarboxylate transport system permease small subunit